MLRTECSRRKTKAGLLYSWVEIIWVLYVMVLITVNNVGRLIALPVGEQHRRGGKAARWLNEIPYSSSRALVSLERFTADHRSRENGTGATMMERAVACL